MTEDYKKTFKKSTWFFPLHPASFYGQDYENKMDLELVNSLSFGCNTYLEKLYFSHLFDLIQSGFWVIPKLTLANLCKPIHSILIIPISPDPLDLENRKGGKTFTKNWISQGKKELFRWSKNHF